jgi:hypothetical protein
MSVRSAGIDGRVWLRGGVDEVLERLHRERCSPDGAARLEVDLVYQLPRVTAVKVAETVDADRFQSLQDTRPAEWYREHA